jgi:hypothetical protein
LHQVALPLVAILISKEVVEAEPTVVLQLAVDHSLERAAESTAVEIQPMVLVMVLVQRTLALELCQHRALLS